MTAALTVSYGRLVKLGGASRMSEPRVCKSMLLQSVNLSSSTKEHQSTMKRTSEWVGADPAAFAQLQEFFSPDPKDHPKQPPLYTDPAKEAEWRKAYKRISRRTQGGRKDFWAECVSQSPIPKGYVSVPNEALSQKKRLGRARALEAAKARRLARQPSTVSLSPSKAQSIKDKAGHAAMLEAQPKNERLAWLLAQQGKPEFVQGLSTDRLVRTGSAIQDTMTYLDRKAGAFGNSLE